MTDWTALITRLERHLRAIDIGAEIGRSEAWVGLLKRGKLTDPPDSVAQLLRELDARYYVPREPYVKRTEKQPLP